MRAAGCVLIVLGMVLGVRSALLLAGRGRPRRGPQPALVIAGPYRRVRNPLLGGLLLALAGVALAAWSLRLALVTLATMVLAHLWVVAVEEPQLVQRHGRVYEAYRRTVPRWCPHRSATARDLDAADDALF